MSLQVPVSRQRRTWELGGREGIDPFRRMSSQMERMFQELMGGSMLGGQGISRGLQGGVGGAELPTVDVSETKDALEIDVDLPGLDERDIDVTLANGVLTISGERKEEREDKSRNFYCAERSYGNFSRRVTLPYQVEEDRIDAQFDRGVLHITLPKSADVKSKERHIQIRKS